MVEVTNDLIYEILRPIQGRLGSLDEGLREVRGEIAALRGHVIAIQQDTANVYGRIAAMEVRLDHIERRLDIADAPSV
ncbi:MAG: hypothetical protein U1E25_04995 [Methylocystis sp.]